MHAYREYARPYLRSTGHGDCRLGLDKKPD